MQTPPFPMLKLETPWNLLLAMSLLGPLDFTTVVDMTYELTPYELFVLLHVRKAYFRVFTCESLYKKNKTVSPVSTFHMPDVEHTIAAVSVGNSLVGAILFESCIIGERNGRCLPHTYLYNLNPFTIYVLCLCCYQYLHGDWIGDSVNSTFFTSCLTSVQTMCICRPIVDYV